MSLDQLRYELRIMGKWVFLMPILVMVCLAFLAGLLAIMHVATLRISQVLTGSLEMLLPIAAGMMVASIAGHDAAMELQLTMPHKYHITAIARLSLIVSWIGGISFFASVFIYHLKFLRVPVQIGTWGVLPQVLIEQLTWLAPLLWFVTIGLCLALLTRSRIASSALLAGIWIIEAIFYGYFVFVDWLKPLFLFPATLAPSINFWLFNRYVVLGTALVLLSLDWLLLHNTEALLQGTAGEE
jgi:hypothetical protein